MCARYRMVRTPNPTGEKKKQALHPRVVPLGTLHTDDLIEEVENRSGISGADIKGALRVLADVVADRLEQGYNVEVENFGFLSVSLSGETGVYWDSMKVLNLSRNRHFCTESHN